MDKLERQILEIINDQGGSVPMDFFATTMRKMEEEGKLKVVFPNNAVTQYKYFYHTVERREG